VKKGIVVLLIVIALVVLVSPGIIGRIAEESVDENLQWAADEHEQVVVPSARFDRGIVSRFMTRTHRQPFGSSSAASPRTASRH